MPTGSGTYEREREALQALLSSPEISRSPNLTRILNYLCGKYFAGESAEVKEYHVALEALGRPADFDQKKDSIVRVEMHRLRRRLKEYHERNHTTGIQLLIPEKSYIPTFIDLNAATALEVSQTPLEMEVVSEQNRLDTPIPKLSPAFALAVLGVLAVGIFFSLRHWSTNTSPDDVRQEVPAGSTAPTLPTPPPGDELRILCGRQPGLYVDRYGQTWDGDRYSKGGEAVQVQAPVIATGFDRNVFHGMRVGHQNYNIPLKQGRYQMEMLFAETEYGDGNPLEGGELSRPFRVLVNGKIAIDEFDVIAETIEPNIAMSRIVTDVSPSSDGMVHLELQATSTGEPFVNAIILKPGIPGKALPVRMVSVRFVRKNDGQTTDTAILSRASSTESVSEIATTAAFVAL